MFACQCAKEMIVRVTNLFGRRKMFACQRDQNVWGKEELAEVSEVFAKGCLGGSWAIASKKRLQKFANTKR